jgi:hypothetical protein
MSKYTKNIKDLLSAIKKTEEKSAGGAGDFKKDFWKPTIEKDQERVEYLIRFLPNTDSIDGVPYVSRPAHMIKFASGNYIYEPCPKRSKFGDCPICKKVNEMYATGNPQQETIASGQNAKKRFFHNILVLEDPRDNKVNEGKVFIYEHGEKIVEKCIEILGNKRNPVVYFDPLDGADFEIVITWEKSTRGTFQNYDKSSFSAKAQITVGGRVLEEDEIDAIVEKSAKLNVRLLDAKCFKSADELAEIYKAQGYKKSEAKTDDNGERVTPSTKKEPADKVVDEKPIVESKPVVKAVEKTVAKKEEADDFAPSSSDDVDAELAKMLAE